MADYTEDFVFYSLRGISADEAKRRDLRPVVHELAVLLSDTLQVVRKYENWYEQSPEDSWRFQRDLFHALKLTAAGEPEDPDQY